MEYTVYYEDSEYGFYTTEVEAPSIQLALEDFIERYAFDKIYGIMVKR